MSEELVAKYLKIQTQIRELEKKHREQMMALETEIEVVAKKILDTCEKNKTDLIETPAGTACRKQKVSFAVKDWDAMARLIKKYSAIQLLEKRVHVSNMKEFLLNNPDVKTDDYIDITKKYTLTVSNRVRVTKPAKK